MNEIAVVTRRHVTAFDRHRVLVRRETPDRKRVNGVLLVHEPYSLPVFVPTHVDIDLRGATLVETVSGSWLVFTTHLWVNPAHLPTVRKVDYIETDRPAVLPLNELGHHGYTRRTIKPRSSDRWLIDPMPSEEDLVFETTVERAQQWARTVFVASNASIFDQGENGEHVVVRRIFGVNHVYTKWFWLPDE